MCPNCATKPQLLSGIQPLFHTTTQTPYSTPTLIPHHYPSRKIRLLALAKAHNWASAGTADHGVLARLLLHIYRNLRAAMRLPAVMWLIRRDFCCTEGKNRPWPPEARPPQITLRPPSPCGGAIQRGQRPGGLALFNTTKAARQWGVIQHGPVWGWSGQGWSFLGDGLFRGWSFFVVFWGWSLFRGWSSGEGLR